MTEGRDRRTAISFVLAVVAVIATVVAGIALAQGGGGEEGTTTVPSAAQAPSAGAVPPAAAPPAASSPSDALPPEMVECLADQGIDVEGVPVNEVFHGDNAVPTQVLNQCFESVYGVAH
jgi:pyruvate/2-oxoglutarate dehydrogenase complex dihydrolipoamide acyltransferase (E2) component